MIFAREKPTADWISEQTCDTGEDIQKPSSGSEKGQGVKFAPPCGLTRALALTGTTQPPEVREVIGLRLLVNNCARVRADLSLTRAGKETIESSDDADPCFALIMNTKHS